MVVGLLSGVSCCSQMFRYHSWHSLLQLTVWARSRKEQSCWSCSISTGRTVATGISLKWRKGTLRSRKPTFPLLQQKDSGCWGWHISQSNVVPWRCWAQVKWNSPAPLPCCWGGRRADRDWKSKRCVQHLNPNFSLSDIEGTLHHGTYGLGEGGSSQFPCWCWSLGIPLRYPFICLGKVETPWQWENLCCFLQKWRSSLKNVFSHCFCFM